MAGRNRTSRKAAFTKRLAREFCDAEVALMSLTLPRFVTLNPTAAVSSDSLV